QTASPLYDRSTKHLITHPLHDAPPILSPAGPTAGTPAFWLVRSSRAPTSNSIRLEPSRHWTNPPTLSEARLGCASRKKPAFVGFVMVTSLSTISASPPIVTFRSVEPRRKETSPANVSASAKVARACMG